MAHRVPITIRLDSFEGPLDLLLYLIQSHELDITKVSISRITDQYVAYVRLMQELDFDIASEFLVMAATLLLWKSKSLLPDENKDQNAAAEEDAELTQEELVRQLLEHQRFREAGEEIAQLPRLNEDVFTRPNRRPPVERVWKTMEITSIALCYQNIVTRARKRTTILKKETVSISDKIMEFGDRLTPGKITELKDLWGLAAERPEIVVTFLASLELARLRKLKVYQQETYQEIYVELLESLKHFNMQLVVGFDAINAAGVADQASKAAAENMPPPPAPALELTEGASL